jgi:hypothetical protein
MGRLCPRDSQSRTLFARKVGSIAFRKPFYGLPLLFTIATPMVPLSKQALTIHGRLDCRQDNTRFVMQFGTGLMKTGRTENQLGFGGEPRATSADQ